VQNYFKKYNNTKHKFEEILFIIHKDVILVYLGKEYTAVIARSSVQEEKLDLTSHLHFIAL